MRAAGENVGRGVTSLSDKLTFNAYYWNLGDDTVDLAVDTPFKYG